jgi:cyclopropane-fatty-acyl-phospholipid synthase
MTAQVKSRWGEDHNNHHRNNAHGKAAHAILRRIFHQYKDAFTVVLWDGSVLSIGHGVPAFTLTIHSSEVLRDLVLFKNPVRLAEAYFDGAVDVSGDFNAAMGLRYYLENLTLSSREKLALLCRAILFPKQNNKPLPQTKKPVRLMRQNNVAAIAFHYDVSNAFYKLWLDEQMVYSCAYFESTEQSLAQAQSQKLDYVCRKLRLQKGETYLDIGCGWGALVCWAAKHYGVRAHGITLSEQQFLYAKEAVARQGLQDLVTIEMRNYRDLPRLPTYDKVSSIGMFEHVGLKNLAEYFSIVHQVLKPHGLFLNHGITSDQPDWRHGASTQLINRHVFPDGELDTVSNIQRRMENARFEIFDVESLRPHYALTLRHWVKRLEEKREEVIRLVGERTYRIWRLYMTGSALQFEQGATSIYQILAERKTSGLPALPLTRQDIYNKG